MSSITEPPETVYCLGYTWTKDRGSGGTQEIFLHDYDLTRRVDDLRKMYPGGTLTNLTVHQLVPDDNLGGPGPVVWIKMNLHLATPTKIGGVIE